MNNVIGQEVKEKLMSVDELKIAGDTLVWVVDMALAKKFWQKASTLIEFADISKYGKFWVAYKQ